MYRAWKLSGIIGRHYHTMCWNLQGKLQCHYMDYCLHLSFCVTRFLTARLSLAQSLLSWSLTISLVLVFCSGTVVHMPARLCSAPHMCDLFPHHETVARLVPFLWHLTISLVLVFHSRTVVHMPACLSSAPQIVILIHICPTSRLPASLFSSLLP